MARKKKETSRVEETISIIDKPEEKTLKKKKSSKKESVEEINIDVNKVEEPKVKRPRKSKETIIIESKVIDDAKPKVSRKKKTEEKSVDEIDVNQQEEKSCKTSSRKRKAKQDLEKETGEKIESKIEIENKKPHQTQKSSTSKKKKNISKSKEFYVIDEGKYVLGDIDELFEEKAAKKIKSFVNKKISKINHGKDEKMGIHFFKVNEKVWDVIDYNVKILTSNKSLILCKDDIIKNGKLKFCKRFIAKDSFKLTVDYTDDDYCLYFQYDEEPSPFMMLQDESII